MCVTCSEASTHSQCFDFLLTFLTGPGIASTVKTGEEVGFVVDAKTAGKGKVTCVILTPDGTEAEADVIENEDGTYDIFYTAAKPGTYVIYVRFGGVDIPNSPFTVMVSRGPSEPAVSRYSHSCHVLIPYWPSYLIAWL